MAIDPHSAAEAQTEADRLIRSALPPFDATAVAAAYALKLANSTSEMVSGGTQTSDG